jgi:hypothetical protein
MPNSQIPESKNGAIYPGWQTRTTEDFFLRAWSGRLRGQVFADKSRNRIHSEAGSLVPDQKGGDLVGSGQASLWIVQLEKGSPAHEQIELERSHKPEKEGVGKLQGGWTASHARL